MRPPKWTYFLPFDNYEGVGYRYVNSTDTFDYEIDFQVSSSDDTFLLEDGVTEATFTSDFNALIAGKITVGDWSFRASYADFMGGTLTVGDITGLSNALIGAGFTEAGQDLLLDDETITIASVGFRGDIDRFWVVGEYTILEMPVSFQTDRKNRYISVGHRWNTVNAWFTYGITSTESHTDRILSKLPPATFVPEVTGATNVLSADINAWSIGLRHDFHESASFKIEYTEENDDFGQNPDGKVLTLGIDTTF